MKRRLFVLKRRLLLLFCIAGCILMSGGLSACGSKKQMSVIYVGSQITLSEYDVATHTEGTVLEDRVIECGKRYKLTFDFDFSGLEKILGDEMLHVTMTVQLGDYENEDNINLLTSGHIAEGIKFTQQQTPGMWKASFILDKDNKPDFKQGYFIIGMDSLGKQDSETDSLEEIISMTQSVTVSFSTEDKDVDFVINNVEEYEVSLRPVKGNFEFTQSENIVTKIGANAAKNNMTIKIPSKCSEIVIDFYTSDSKTEMFGTERFNLQTNPDEFKKTGLIDIVVSDYIQTFMGKAEYEEMISEGAIRIYLVITAVGGNNYNDSVIEMTYEIY